MPTLGASTLAVTVNAVAKTLNRINQDSYGSEYLLRETLVEYSLKVRHSKTNAGYDRHNVEFVMTTYATASAPQFTRKVYFVVEVLPSDPDVTVANGLLALAIASTNQVLTDLNAWIP